MKTLKFEDRDSWMMARKGKITGTRLKDIVMKRGMGKKMGYYELIAERLAVELDGDDPNEDPRERGNRLEDQATARFEKETGKKVDTTLIIWQHDENENIAVSPDGVISKTEALEIKCLSSARHIEAYMTKQIPDEYQYQKLQYFIVNEKLRKLNFVFFDPRLPALDYFVIEVKRESVKDQIAEYLEYQKQTLQEIEKVISELTF